MMQASRRPYLSIPKTLLNNGRHLDGLSEGSVADADADGRQKGGTFGSNPIEGGAGRG